MRDIAFWEARLKYHEEQAASIGYYASPQSPLRRNLGLKQIARWRMSCKRRRKLRQQIAKHQTKIAYCQERIEALRKLTHWDHLRKGLGVCG